MGTIKDYINKLDLVITRLPRETENSILRNKKRITNLNIEQIEESEGNDGKILKNTNSRFKGFYSPTTVAFSREQSPLLPKVAGMPYNFVNTGDALSNFEIDFDRNKLAFSIYSTGIGTGEKRDFFDGYRNFFGLNKQNTEIVNYEILKYDIDEFCKRYL